jgi:Fic family protein
MPRTRNEREIAGYRDVLNTVHENFNHIPIRDTFILQLHRDLYKFENATDGGKFKNVDNVIEEEDSKGNKFVRFKPLPAWETPEAIMNLCVAYNEAINRSEADPLLIMPMFIIDFLCIHPFKDGNGRMSRLLTLLLLYQNGYIVGKYISLEKLIERTKDNYYDALQESSQGWIEDKNDYESFVKYILGIITAAYREFFDRAQIVEEKKVSKPDRIEELIKNHLGTITKSEIVEATPGISATTVQRTLTDLVKAEKIIKIGNGRYTKYKWNWDKEN